MRERRQLAAADKERPLQGRALPLGITLALAGACLFYPRLFAAKPSGPGLFTSLEITAEEPGCRQVIELGAAGEARLCGGEGLAHDQLSDLESELKMVLRVFAVFAARQGVGLPEKLPSAIPLHLVDAPSSAQNASWSAQAIPIVTSSTVNGIRKVDRRHLVNPLALWLFDNLNLGHPENRDRFAQAFQSFFKDIATDLCTTTL